jgi:hypothetical protein
MCRLRFFHQFLVQPWLTANFHLAQAIMLVPDESYPVKCPFIRDPVNKQLCLRQKVIQHLA